MNYKFLPRGSTIQCIFYNQTIGWELELLLAALFVAVGRKMKIIKNETIFFQGKQWFLIGVPLNTGA